MKIATGWPNPIDFVNNEIKTLNWLRNSTKLEEAQWQLVHDAQKAYFEYKNAKLKNNFQFKFSSWITFPNPSIKKAFIQCLISSRSGQKLDYDMFTYAFGLCRQNIEGELHLIRKFHIDFTNRPDTGRAPLQPVFHLQYPGKLSHEIKAQGITDAHLEPSLSEPRLCTTPITLALLTDFLLREFGGDFTSPLSKLTKDSNWRGLIRKDEELVLKPYFEACNTFFHDQECKKDPEKSQLFTQDFVYGQN